MTKDARRLTVGQARQLGAKMRRKLRRDKAMRSGTHSVGGRAKDVPAPPGMPRFSFQKDPPE